MLKQLKTLRFYNIVLMIICVVNVFTFNSMFMRCLNIALSVVGYQCLRDILKMIKSLEKDIEDKQ